jgi:hypothetical protein
MSNSIGTTCTDTAFCEEHQPTGTQRWKKLATQVVYEFILWNLWIAICHLGPDLCVPRICPSKQHIPANNSAFSSVPRIGAIYLFIYLFILDTCIALILVCALSALHSHTHATWVKLESRLHNSGAHDQSLPVSFSRASFSNHFFLHSYFTFFLPTFFHLSI